MTQRISFRREYFYDYQPSNSPAPRDAGAATCRWCSQTWQAEHRIEYSPCCYVPRVKYGEVSLMRRPRHPFLRPVKQDRLLRGGVLFEQPWPTLEKAVLAAEAVLADAKRRVMEEVAVQRGDA